MSSRMMGRGEGNRAWLGEALCAGGPDSSAVCAVNSGRLAGRYVGMPRISRMRLPVTAWHHVLPVRGASGYILLKAGRLAQAHPALRSCLAVCWSSQPTASCHNGWSRWYVACLRGRHQSHGWLPWPLVGQHTPSSARRQNLCLSLTVKRLQV